MKRLMGLALVAGMLFMLGGCVYGPGYYQRPGVVYDDGTATYSGGGPAGYYGADDGDYAPAYYGGYGYAYDPWCCYGGYYPWIGLGFYGSYYHGYHGYHGGGWHGGGGHGGGGSHGSGGGHH
jgi:hypothetical protein